ncbi:hypothetical protein C0991_006892 [Blastosporella zonata]|nr:hypothetical protein C0991_006892 [Blastosporella zonata]
MNAEALDGRLLFAIPKKGRLYEKCIELLAGADIQFRRSNRLDVCVVLNHNIALVFLPAADIPSFVGKGDVDLGITGHDVVLEAQMEGLVTEVARLGFGKCSLQVQVPEASSIKTVEDLAGKRVVSSFKHLSREYFSPIDDRLQLTGDNKTKIGYVGGSVEAACALGLADGIVDLVESGDTMRASGLHAIATLLTTEAILIKSTTPKHPHLAPLIDKVASRIAGVIAANRYVICQYNISRDKLPAAILITPGRRAPTISRLEEENWVAVSVMIEKNKSASIMDELVKAGAEDILVFNLNNSPSRRSNHVLHEKRAADPLDWTARRLETHKILPMRFGLTQQNLHRMEEMLMAVSHPESPTYGRHWTPAEVVDTFAPSDETIAAVTEWLSGAGISADRLRLSPSKGWIDLNATVAEVEDLIMAEYHVYSHEESGYEQIGKWFQVHLDPPY